MMQRQWDVSAMVVLDIEGLDLAEAGFSAKPPRPNSLPI
jgi:hypothetical protein